MKKLLPTSKLYNFNAKVFKNYIFLASKLIFLTSIFFLIPIKSVEANVDETEILRLQDKSGNEKNVYYVGNKAGNNTYLKAQCLPGDLINLTACWWNGIRDQNTDTIYNKSTKEFISGDYKTYGEGFPSEQIAKKGFCAYVFGMKSPARESAAEVKDTPKNYIKFQLNPSDECTHKVKGRYDTLVPTTTSGGVTGSIKTFIEYNYFKDGVGSTCRNQFIYYDSNTDESCGSRAPKRKINDREACAPNIRNDGNGFTFYTVQNCNASIYGDNKRWVTSAGWYLTCKEAYKSTGAPDDEVTKTCQYFVCEKYRWLKDSNPGITCGECEYKDMTGANPDTALSSCTFDKSAATANTNCYSESKYIKSSDHNFEDARLKDKNFFCAPNNKVAVCDKSLDTYDKVFNPKLVGGTPPRQSGVLNTFKDPEKCKFYEDLTEAPEATCSGIGVQPCNIPDPKDGNDPISCCFGSGTGATFCGATSGEKATNPVSKDSAAKPGHKLYCASDGKVIRCPGPVRRFIAQPGTGGAPETNGVMRTGANLSSTNKYPDCEIVTEESLNDCNISEDSNKCSFGDISSEKNCFDKKETGKKGSMNLFCDKNGKVTACPEAITEYNQAFPGIENKNGPYDRAEACQEYDESKEDLVEFPEEDCDLSDEGRMFFGEEVISDEQDKAYKTCLMDRARMAPEKPEVVAEGCRKTTFGAEAINQSSFKQCLCDVSYNPQYDFFWCNMWPNEEKCKKFCKLFESEFGAVGILEVQEAVSPLNLIKTISDFLFAFAVLIFIINMLRASLLYVTSGGDESKMKEAQSTATNTVFGMIFIVFIGALIRWVIGSTGTFINE